MSRYETQDLKWTDDGDLALGEGKDLALASGNELIHQMVANPMKITNPDWFSDAIGADMEDLLGLENSRATGELGKTKITSALLKTEFFKEEDIWIESRPTGLYSMIFVVFINSPFSENGPIVYEIKVDLGFGTTVRRIF